MQMLKSTLQQNHKPCRLESKKDNPQESSKREVLRWANRIWIQNKSYGASAHQSMGHQTQTSTDLRPMIHCTICTNYIYIYTVSFGFGNLVLCFSMSYACLFLDIWSRWKIQLRETWSTYDMHSHALSRLPKDQVQLLHVERLVVKWKQGERIRACNCWHDFPPTTPQLTLDVQTKSENLGPKMRGNKPVDCRKPLRNQKVWRCPNRGVMRDKKKVAFRKFMKILPHS